MTPDSFPELAALQEWDYRVARNIERLAKGANFRYNDASVAQIDYTLPRGLTATRWNVLPRWILSAKETTCSSPAVPARARATRPQLWDTRPARPACVSAYANASKPMGTLKIAKTKGTIEAELKKLEKTQLLILDDLFLVPLDAKERAHLTEIIEDRHGRKSIIVTSQLPELTGTMPSETPQWRMPSSTASYTPLTVSRQPGESVRKLKAFSKADKLKKKLTPSAKLFRGQ